MNILFQNSIGRETWGGGEKWMLTTAIGLRERGHRVFFVGRDNSLFLKNCQEAGFPVFALNIKSDFGLINIIRLAKIFRENDIDIVIANFNKDVRLAGIARKIARVPLLLARNGLPILQNNWRYRYTYKDLADGIITNTPSIKERYLSYGWIEEDFVRVIHNGIPSDWEIDFKKEEIRKELGIEKYEFIIGIFGRLVKQKQHTIFLDVARNILKEWPKVAFLIVGEGPLRENITRYASELGILSNIYFLGFKKNVMKLYSVCDIILLTSEEEGLPNTVMEAMLAGKPVVAFNVGGVSELIIPDKTGILIPPNDIYLMTQRTQELLLSETMRATLGRQARQYILENFSLEKMIDEIENYFMEMLKNKRERKNGT